MQENENQEQEQDQQDIHDVIAHAKDLLFVQKKSPTEAKRALIQKGLTSEIAAVVVDNLTEYAVYKNDYSNIDKNDHANRDMLFGALWFFGGVIVTVATLSAASGGGTYVVAWGAIIFGAVQFFRGVLNRE